MIPQPSPVHFDVFFPVPNYFNYWIVNCLSLLARSNAVVLHTFWTFFTRSIFESLDLVATELFKFRNWNQWREDTFIQLGRCRPIFMFFLPKCLPWFFFSLCCHGYHLCHEESAIFMKFFFGKKLPNYSLSVVFCLGNNFWHFFCLRKKWHCVCVSVSNLSSLCLILCWEQWFFSAITACFSFFISVVSLYLLYIAFPFKISLLLRNLTPVEQPTASHSSHLLRLLIHPLTHVVTKEAVSGYNGRCYGQCMQLTYKVTGNCK